MTKWVMKYRVSCVALLVLVASSGAFAQDAQFSQQMAAPLLINPALSGADDFLRGAVSYRTQWNAVSDPFTTAAGSFDIALNQRPDPRKRKKGKPGLGISFLTDRAGSPMTRKTKVMLTGAYHVYLNKNSNLGAGLYAGYQSQSLDAKSGKWGSQYNGMQYDPNLGHGENLQSIQQTSLNVGGGLVYVYQRNANLRHRIKRREFKIGLAGYHFGRVTLTEGNLFSDDDDIRFSGFASAAFGVGKSGSAIEPAVFYHRQGPSQMLLAGLAYRYVFRSGESVLRDSKPVSLALGGYYRFGDAAIARASFCWEGLEIGLSYDINTSGLSRYSSARVRLRCRCATASALRRIAGNRRRGKYSVHHIPVCDL